jgi:hypothetical protein
MVIAGGQIKYMEFINMKYTNIGLRQVLLVCCASLFASATYALPALQLGPTTVPSTDWTYDTVTDTWVYSGASDGSADLSAFANSDTVGASGDYAWDDAGATTQYAYLVVAAVPDLGDVGALFDVTVVGGELFDFGYGAPPVEDPNSLQPHGIYDSYFEVYRFQFDGPVVDISNTQPPAGTDSGDGYKEDFLVSVNSLAAGVTGVHFDLFTVSGDGTYAPGQSDDVGLVNASAPISYDAQWNPGDLNPVPIPAAAWLFGSALLGLGALKRNKA